MTKQHERERIGIVCGGMTSAAFITDRLRQSWLGQLYVRRLKGNTVARGIARYSWRHLFPLYLHGMGFVFFYKVSLRWRPMTKLESYVKKVGCPVYQLAPAAVVETPVPTTVWPSDKKYIGRPHDRYAFPQVYAAEVRDATVYGRTNLVVVGKDVLYHDLYDFTHDYTSEERHLRTLINYKGMKIRWYGYDNENIPLVPVAAAFLDACAFNYAHWLTEVLSRIVLFCKDDRFQHVPLIVDEILHENLFESLKYVAGDRQIIRLAADRAMNVEKLYVTSVAGYIQFERRFSSEPWRTQGMYSPYAFQAIRDYMLPLIEKLSIDFLPDKICIRRSAGIRAITNGDELGEFLLANGYTIIEPEKLTFLQQVKIFNHAKVIVGSSGAAMASIIFAREDAKILMVMSRQLNNIYWFWQSIACAAHNTINYVLGDLAKKSEADIHADYSVDLRDLALGLSRLDSTVKPHHEE